MDVILSIFSKFTGLRRTFAGILLILLALFGCQMPAASNEKTPIKEAPIPTPIATILPSPTPVVVLMADNVSVKEMQKQPPVPPPVQEPLRFTFPTAEAEPGTLWRPPLYPVPWEPTQQDHFYFIRPIGANEVNWPLARYRYGGVFFANAHTGIDIPAPKGTPVLAAGTGEVIWAGYGLSFLSQEYRDSYGIAVAIKHDFGYQGQMVYSVYAHMDSTTVVQGQRVETGDVIGVVGETGETTGPHLHFEVRLGDNRYFGSRNPELWIAPPQGWGVLVGRVMNFNGTLIQRLMVELRDNRTNHYYYVHTYGEGPVNSDAYYQENVVLGDLPAGTYTLWIDYESVVRKTNIEINPGMVTYFSFKGSRGFDTTLPPTPQVRFIPPDATAIATP
jgi:murein DD-endopeptidase MepM/ murein hydrolase activator NlpD